MFLSFSGNRLLGGVAITLCLTSLPTPPSAAAEFEEITVTAQRREERLQDVPLAVSAYSGEALQAAQLTSTQDLTKLSPTLTFTGVGNPVNSSFRLRGVGTQSFSPGVEPSVSLVVDGVVLSRQSQGLFDLLDIERIEVLRGPQGTLFGKNASGGVVHVLTKRPADEFEASVRATVAQDEEYSLQWTASAPLSDSVGYRVTGSFRDQGGFVRNVFNGEELNGGKHFNLRSKIEWQAADDINILMSADFGRSDTDCCQFLPLFNPDAPDPEGYLAILDPAGASEENREVNVNSTVFNDVETWGLSAELNYDLPWGGTLTSITAFRDWWNIGQVDVDTQPNVGIAVPGIFFTFTFEGNGPETSLNTFSQELRLASPTGERIEWVAGLFYWDLDLDEHQIQRFANCAGPNSAAAETTQACPAPFFTSTFADSTVENTNLAVFGQVNVDITQRLEAFAGLRLIREELDYSALRPNEPLPGFPDDAVESFGVTLPLSVDGKIEDTDWSGRFGLQYALNDNARIYGSYSRGYKGPAANLGLSATQDPVQPETVDSFELGLRTELLDDRLRFNLTGFSSEYDNLQSQSIDQSTPPSGSFLLTNVGVFETQGVEVEFAAAPTESLTLSGGIAFVDAVFKSFPNAQCYARQTPEQGCLPDANGNNVQDLSGKDSPNSPDLKYSLTARFDRFLSQPRLNMFIQGSYVWQDDILFREDQSPKTFQESYGLFDLNLGFVTENERLEFSVFAKNLFDEHFATNRIDFGFLAAGRPAVQNIAKNANRYFGASVRLNF